ncbi:uncharacterized protein BXZ73DRAFT_46765 [Epithele typhae]|uniref:uncharacterized protein n=1 Tax=Epithele typhae TaxID=378194 RepID=UPI0020076188|nr:uncharacterized protein BXZ73DRAFT_46765 [Epithele typhae]KAH9932791.1 hypothetical protein BXZ73DRAFT_46765 [Epithele typhae]
MPVSECADCFHPPRWVLTETNGSRVLTSFPAVDCQCRRDGAVTLNIDVFRAVLSFLSTSELIGVSQSSHLFHEEAWKEMLSRPVFLNSHKQFASFHHFLANGDPVRYCFLRVLSLYNIVAATDNMVQWSVDALTQIIRSSIHLEKLDILGCEKLLFSRPQPDFVSSIASLRHLRHILCSSHVKETHPHALELLHNLPQHTLKSLQFNHFPDMINLLTADFLNLLAQRQPQLEDVSLTYPSIVKGTWKPFANVTVLKITIADGWIHLPQLVEMFPRAMEVCASSLTRMFTDPNPAPFEELAQDPSRVAALAFQDSGRGWPLLHSLSGSSFDLFSLALTCPVRRVVINPYEPHRAWHEPQRDIIARTRPKRVDLTTSCADYARPLPSAGPNLLVYDSGPTPGAVTHLVIGLSVFMFRPPPNVTANILVRGSPVYRLLRQYSGSAPQESIAPFLQGSRVEYVHLAIAEYFGWGEIDEDAIVNPNPARISDKNASVAASIDIALLVSGIAATAPTIRAVVLTISMREQSVWEIQRQDGHLMSRRLEQFAGRRLVREEERYRP